jgi:hypothetical protein
MMAQSPFARAVVRLWAAGATVLVLLLAATGCGSKISEANYYKVQHGMSEDAVEDLLGPAQGETFAETAEPGGASRPATGEASAGTTRPSSRPADRKVKTWTRGGLILRVVFEDGRVVGRTADGIPFESGTVRAAHAAPGSPDDRPLSPPAPPSE